MTDGKGVLFVPYQDTLGLLSVDDALRSASRSTDARPRQRGVVDPPSFKLDVAEEFHNHWHVKSVFLKEIPTTGVRVYNYYDDGVRNTVGGLDCTRYIVLSDPHSGEPVAIVDEHGAMPSAAPRPRRSPASGLGQDTRKSSGLVGVGTMGTNSLRCLAHHVQVRGNPLHLAAAGNARGVRGEMVAGARHPVVPKDSIEEVVRGADIAVGGTTSGEIVSREHGSSPAAPSSRSRVASSIRPAGRRWTRS